MPIELSCDLNMPKALVQRIYDLVTNTAGTNFTLDAVWINVV